MLIYKHSNCTYIFILTIFTCISGSISNYKKKRTQMNFKYNELY